MAGIAHATLVIEAQERSGTLITARMTADYNRELMVVPGSIFSKNSAGVHQFLKLGATPVTCAEDIILALGMELMETSDHKQTSLLASLSAEEQKVLQSLHEPLHKDLLMRSLALDTARANVLLMQMELKGIIASENNVYRAVI
jgi:DNA processing protein